MFTWLVLFSLMPLLVMLCVSFLSHDSTHVITPPWTLKHYLNLISPMYAPVFFRSLCMSFVTCYLCLLLAYPFSYVLVKSKHQSILLLLVMIPFWTSSLVRTYALLALFKLHGVFNAVLLSLHLIHHPITWLYTSVAVIAGLVYTLFPFMVLPLFTNMGRFDSRLIEAAKDLGARPLRIFFRVYLPHTQPGIRSGCLLVFLPAMTLFYIPNLLGGARSILIGNVIQQQFLVVDNWPQGAATGISVTCLLIVLASIRLRSRKKGR